MRKILILGLGRGTSLAKAAVASDKLELAGVIDSNPERVKDAEDICRLKPNQLFTDLEMAIRNTEADILVVATPTRLHHEHVMAGMENGFHVLCEKPLCANRRDALSLQDAAVKFDRRLAVIQNMRYLPQVRKCRELVKDGLVGDLSVIEMNFHRWRPPGDLRHAVLFNHGVHHIDMIRAIAPGALKHMQAMEWDPQWANDDRGRFLRLSALMEEGWVVAYNASYGEAGRETPQTGELRIVGSKGTIEVTGDPDFNPTIRFHSVERATGTAEDRRVFVERMTWNEIDKRILEEFSDSVESGKPAETDITDNIHTLEWLFQAEEVLPSH